MKKRWMKIIPLVILLGTAGALAFSGLVMLLWNGIFPAVFHVGAITIWQAAGILLLSKILFSGFKGRHGHNRWKKQMFGQWQDMTEEEKQMFRERARGCRRFATVNVESK